MSYRTPLLPHEVAQAEASVRERRFQRRHGAEPAEFQEGYRSWATHQSLPNPYPEGTEQHGDFERGLQAAAEDYDWEKEKFG